MNNSSVFLKKELAGLASSVPIACRLSTVFAQPSEMEVSLFHSFQLWMDIHKTLHVTTKPFI